MSHHIKLSLEQFSGAFQHKIKHWMEQEGVSDEVLELEELIDIGMNHVCENRIQNKEACTEKKYLRLDRR